MARKGGQLQGKRFGRLVVSKLDHRREFPSRQKTNIWQCTCDCGNVILVQQSNLTTAGGHTESCGCVLVDMKTTHGMNESVEYKVYYSMRSRCLDEKHKAFKNYGGRGIQVEWDSFESFYEDMGKRPSDKHTVERVDVNGNYSKENCVWPDDSSLQSFNQRLMKNNKSGKTGVFLRGDGRWVASISFKRKSTYLGLFSSFEDAVKAREESEIKYYGFTKE